MWQEKDNKDIMDYIYTGSVHSSQKVFAWAMYLIYEFVYVGIGKRKYGRLPDLHLQRWHYQMEF